MVAGTPLPLVVCGEEEEEVAYENALAGVVRAGKDEAHVKEEKEEAAYQKQLAEAIALSDVSDAVVPPLAPPPSGQVCTPGTGMVREWVSAPPVSLDAMLEQEAAYLEHWRQRRVREEGEEARRIELLECEAEAEEEERRAA
ncbi:putative serine/threonine-protein kinase [Hordeum vulgare]|nr:putative serine/threonine-protein kinase [Hordeum vulgare]